MAKPKTKRTNSTKHYVVPTKTIDFNILLYVVGMSSILLGLIYASFIASVIYPMFSVPFMLVSIGIVILLGLFITSMLDDILMYDEIVYKHEDFSQIYDVQNQ